MEKQPMTNNTNLYLLIGGLIILAFVSGCVGIAGFLISNRIRNSVAGNNNAMDEISTKCFNEGGKWQANTKECEMISEPSCRALGGIYNACASPCRNAGGQVMCIQMCVQVCTFK